MEAPRNPLRDPFDQPDSPGTDQPSSATGVFGQVPAAPRAEEDLLASLLGQATPEKKAAEAELPKPAVAAPSVSVGAEPVNEPAPLPAAEPEASRSPGEFTRMLQALTIPGAGASAGSKAAPSAPETGRTNEVARVFSPVAMEKPPDEQTVGISTATPSQVSESRPVAPGGISKTESGAPAGSAAPGAFTRMFSSMGASASSGSVAAPTPAASKPVSPAPAPPSQVSESRAGAPAAQSGPSEFTQMFSSQGASGGGSMQSSLVSESRPGAPAPAAPQSGPGEFTRMFSSPASMPPSQGSESRPGAPTNLSGESRSGPPAAQSEPGAFTKMFASQGASVPAHEDPLRSLKQEPAMESGLRLSVPQAPAAPPQAPAAAGGFTQLLQALNQEPKPKEPGPLATSSFAPMTPAPAMPSPAPPAPAASAAAGGFTQLLQSLAQPGASAAPPAAPPPLAPAPYAAPAAAPPAPPAPASPWATPPSLPPSAPPPAPSGPGEFTRVISGSALRDLQGAQGMPAAAPPPPAPAAGPAWTPPQMPKPPAMPHMPAAMPPGMPGMGGAPGMHAGMPPAGGGGMPFTPQAFGMPQAAPPPPMPAAPPQTTLQKYLPLILVLNVFLLVVIVLILFFVMHHK